MARFPRLRRALKLTAKALGGLLAAVFVFATVVLTANCSSFGKKAEGQRLARMEASPQWKGGGFENPQPLWNDTSFAAIVDMVTGSSEHASPEHPDRSIPVTYLAKGAFDQPPPSGLRVTWFGHSSLLIEVDGKRILTDPVWGPSPFPVTWMGPQRWYQPPMALADLPKVDAVVISHDHYDHLDLHTFERIKTWDTTFFVPLGVGAHLEYWGVPADRIVELDWWGKGTVGDLEIVCTPARHASGRGVFDQNHTLWAGWALLGPTHRVFFSGDTGLFDGMKTIGERLGPFDLTMVEIGAYDAKWPDWHSGPEQAVLAHQWLRGQVFLPIHWGLFDLALHGWTEPAERALVAAKQAGIQMFIPHPGQMVEPSSPPPLRRWWPKVPWETAAQHPIVANAANGRPPRQD